MTSRNSTVTAHTGPHPDLPTRTASWVEINGEPVRVPQGGVDTYTDHAAADFAARSTARRLARGQ